MGNPELNERRESIVAVPVEMTGVGPGLTPAGNCEARFCPGKAEEGFVDAYRRNDIVDAITDSLEKMK